MKKLIVGSVSLLAGIGIGIFLMGEISIDVIKKNSRLSDKHLSLFLLMNQWVQVKQKGMSVAEYLTKNNYKQIAIYGMSYMGGTLVKELKDTEVIVKYGIDIKPDEAYADIDVSTPDQEMPEVAAIIVTAVSALSEIENMLHEQVCCPVISLEDILYGM